METRRRDELPFRANAFEEHDQLELEEDHRVDTGPAALGVQLPRPLSDKAQVKRRLQVPVEVVSGDEVLQ
jgi:hypothetical protein